MSLPLEARAGIARQYLSEKLGPETEVLPENLAATSFTPLFTAAREGISNLSQKAQVLNGNLNETRFNLDNLAINLALNWSSAMQHHEFNLELTQAVNNPSPEQNPQVLAHEYITKEIKPAYEKKNIPEQVKNSERFKTIEGYIKEARELRKKEQELETQKAHINGEIDCIDIASAYIVALANGDNSFFESMEAQQIKTSKAKREPKQPKPEKKPKLTWKSLGVTSEHDLTNMYRALGSLIDKNPQLKNFKGRGHHLKLVGHLSELDEQELHELIFTSNFDGRSIPTIARLLALHTRIRTGTASPES